MKKVITLGVIALFAGCAANQPTPQPKPQPKPLHTDKNLKVIQAFVKNSNSYKNNSYGNIKKIARYDDKVVDVKEAKNILLKTNPLFAKKYKKAALQEKVPLAPNAPLYIPPRFAEMIVFPYVSKDGIYHDTQVVWVKIKNGEFVLNQKPNKVKEKIFTINQGY